MASPAAQPAAPKSNPEPAEPSARPAGGAPESALQLKTPAPSDLQRPIPDAVAAAGLVPLMGALHEYLEQERRRNARRMFAMGMAFVVILAIAVAWPVYLGQKFLKRVDQSVESGQQSLQRFSQSVQTGMSELGQATAELRRTVESQNAVLKMLAAHATTSGAAPRPGPYAEPAVTNASGPVSVEGEPHARFFLWRWFGR